MTANENSIAALRATALFSETTTKEIERVLNALFTLSTQMNTLEERLSQLQTELEKSNKILMALGEPK